MFPIDEGDKWASGPPPNMRTVECCNTCKHVEWHYEGERSCTKYRVIREWMDPDDDPGALSVDQNDICDSHERRST